jgi:hypothetical protein
MIVSQARLMTKSKHFALLRPDRSLIHQWSMPEPSWQASANSRHGYFSRESEREIWSRPCRFFNRSDDPEIEERKSNSIAGLRSAVEAHLQQLSFCETQYKALNREVR